MKTTLQNFIHPPLKTSTFKNFETKFKKPKIKNQ